MKRWFETKGHALCWWLAVMRVDHGQPWGWLETAWTTIWWRYYCPRPVIDDWTARAWLCRRPLRLQQRRPLQNVSVDKEEVRHERHCCASYLDEKAGRWRHE